MGRPAGSQEKRIYISNTSVLCDVTLNEKADERDCPPKDVTKCLCSTTSLKPTDSKGKVRDNSKEVTATLPEKKETDGNTGTASSCRRPRELDRTGKTRRSRRLPQSRGRRPGGASMRAAGEIQDPQLNPNLRITQTSLRINVLKMAQCGTGRMATRKRPLAPGPRTALSWG